MIMRYTIKNIDKEGIEAYAQQDMRVHKDLLDNLSLIQTCVAKHIPLVIQKIKDSVVITLNNKDIILPLKYVTLEQTQDVGDVAVLPQRNSLVAQQHTELSNMTINELTRGVEGVKQHISLVEQKQQEMRKRVQEEIQRMQEQMQQQLAVLEAEKEQMERKVFVMENYIYKLRCLLGDSIDIKVLKEGSYTPIETPIVIYQKLHYLDEDFVRFNALYPDAWQDEDYVEDAFANNETLLNVFCPSPKCVSLIKVSKDSKYFVGNDLNCLDTYSVINGSRIAILIKDGQNLVIVYTEKEHISLKEDFFVSTEEESVNLSSIDSVKDLKKNVAAKQYMSRIYLFDILEGLRQFTPYLRLNESIYTSTDVIWSAAEGWLEDNRYASLRNYIYTQKTVVGDVVYVWQRLTGFISSGSWFGTEDRGKAINRRSYDANIKQGIQRINFVQTYKRTGSKLLEDSTKKQEIQSKFLEMIKKGVSRQRTELSIKEGNVIYYTPIYSAGTGYYYKETVDDDYIAFDNRRRMISRENVYVQDLEEIEPEYYISCEKTLSDKNSRANIRIFKDEFLNLTYVSSDMVKYWLYTKKVDSVKGNYASIVSDLTQILDYVEKREQSELSIVSNVAKKNMSGYAIQLNDFKQKHSVRNINEYQAKRFIKWLQDSYKV